MKNQFESLPSDLNSEKPAKRHQESGRKEAENEVQDPSRRKFLGSLLEGAAVGIGTGAAVKGLGYLYRTFSKKREAELKKENSEASEIEDKLDFISTEMDKIKGETAVSLVNMGVINRSEKFPQFKEEFDFLKKEGKKFRAKQDSIPVSVMFSRLEKLENEVSIEALKLEHRM